MRTRRAGAGPRVWPGPREPCQPQRPGGHPVCRPTAGPAQAPSPPPAEDRQEAGGPAGWAAGRVALSSRTGWAGQDNLAGGNAAKSQPRAPGPRTGTRAPCTAVTRQHARRPGTPGTPRSPRPSRAWRPGAASVGFPLAAPRPQTQPAERPPADPREDGVGCGVTPQGGPVPPSRSGADGAGASLGTPSALHDTLTLQASGGRDAGPGLRLTKTHARHSKERRNRTSE